MRITSMKNGPNKIEGLTSYTVLRDGKTETIERATVFLCRCGQSQNKPFCDGTHNKVGFEAPEAVVELA